MDLLTNREVLWQFGVMSYAFRAASCSKDLPGTGARSGEGGQGAASHSLQGRGRPVLPIVRCFGIVWESIGGAS
jgi:hypothetical protein